MIPDSDRIIDYNRFAYARNNPLRYQDESGHIAWDIIDAAFWVLSLKDFIEEPTWINAGLLALDTISLLPIVPSMGYATRGGRFVVDLTTNVYKQSDRVAGLVNKVKKSVPAGRALTRISQDSLETVERYGIDTFSNLKSTPKRIPDSEYHHLVEKCFHDQLGFSNIREANQRILSIELPKGFHRTDPGSITSQIRNKIG